MAGFVEIRKEKKFWRSWMGQDIENGHQIYREIDVSKLVGSPTHVDMIDNQIRTRSLHESDFRAFGLFQNPECLFFDIGANIGNSALSLHSVQPKWEVISFEPNLALRPHLLKIAAIFEKDQIPYTLHHIGLGSVSGLLSLYVPCIDDWHVVGESSFDLEHFKNPVVAKRLSSYSTQGRWSLDMARLPVARFDDFAPVQQVLKRLNGREGLFVKIDVEGFEDRVLNGMSFFIDFYRPHLMVENDPADHVPEIMASHNYSVFRFDERTLKFVRVADRRGYLNLFYFHKSHIEAEYFQRLLL